MPFQPHCDPVSDVEAQQQINPVYSVSMSIRACLAWHVLSFVLGILATALVVWGFMARGVGARGYTALGP
jgi:hypothetical protein